jgi:TPR repeat protein
MQTLCKQTAKQTNAQQPSLRDAKQTPPSLRGAKRRSSLGLKLTQKLQTLFKLLLLSITLTTTLVAQDMYRPPYESTLNIEPRAKQWYRDAALDSDAAFNIGVIYHKTIKNLQRAKQWFLYSWSLKKNPRTANNLGFVYKDLKEYEKAKQWYEKAVERE